MLFRYVHEWITIPQIFFLSHWYYIVKVDTSQFYCLEYSPDTGDILYELTEYAQNTMQY